LIDVNAHRDVPFDQVVKALQLRRDPSRGPLFQITLNWRGCDTQMQFLQLEGLSASHVPFHTGCSKYDLSLAMTDAGEEIWLQVEYNTVLFDDQMIARLAAQFERLLDNMMSDPARHVDDVSIVTEAERQQLLVDWNDTAVAYPRDKCVHQLFEEQVERTPAAVAVVFEGQELTYRALNESANRLAHHLRGLGVGPGSLVGLCLERSPDLVVAILGILKAGGAYVPLDAEYPAQRLQFMLTEAKVGVLVTQDSLRGRLPARDCQVVCLDTDSLKLQRAAGSNLSLPMSADDLAYVMFTSGSTGQPKGVAIRHTSIARLVCGNDYTSFGPNRVFLQLAPISFDATSFELWGALLHGAKLVIAPSSLADFRQLEDLLKRNRVTTLWLTATLLNQIVDHYPQALTSVEEILTGGEALSVPHIAKAQAILGNGVQFVNGYGPTESTTFTTCFRIPAPFPAAAEGIPIGRPIANTQVYVLDQKRMPVPIGVPGELYIGGAGLACGYLNRPELTAEHFVAHPFRDTPGARLYRTGDRCRWRADGNLEFLGRIDNQVKLRGFRIEPGEIESVLNQHPSVAQSVVALREAPPGDKRLVAFCVQAGAMALDAAALTQHLRSRLPSYMVPSAIVPLEALPLTPSGKVDRQQLQSLPINSAQPRSEYLGPRNSMEELLYAVWQELLQGRPFGIRDDFFALGGHSLLAVTMVDRVERLTGRKLPLAQVFAGATIGQLSEVLLKEPEVKQEEPLLVQVQVGGGKRPFFFLDGDFRGGGFYCLKLARHLGADQPFYALHPHGVSGPRLLTSVQAMAADYLERVRAVQPEGPYLLGGYCNGAVVAFEMAQRLHGQGHQVGLLVLLDPMPMDREFEARTLPDRLAERLQLGSLPLHHRRPIAMKVCYYVCRQYVPRPYSGSLTILQPKERLHGCKDTSRGWRHLAQEIEVHVIPGSHETCLTAHGHVVGEQLRNSLARATQAANSHQASGRQPIGPLPAGREQKV
jgi:amino acid adenylation domain-containing protein